MSVSKHHPVQRQRGLPQPRWENWAGNQRAAPRQLLAPASVEEVSAAVLSAAERGLPVKAVGSGHSFSSVAATDGLMIRPDRMTAVRELNREAGRITVEAGLPLHRLNVLLSAAGLALRNMGDVMVQTAAGAVSTGTHGTGRDSASLSDQLLGMELVTADGAVRQCSRTEQPELFAAARLGLGALGVISALTFAVEPAFLLTAREEPMELEAVLDGFEELATGNEHFEFYWFPHTGRTMTKRNNRSSGEARPLPAVRGWLDDEFLSNGVFEVVNRVGRRIPATVPAIARLSSRALSARTYTDEAYRVFTSPRRVRFVEMEYAVDRPAAPGLLRELKSLMERSGWRVSFPVEVRTAPADDALLSTAHGRDTAYIAVHMYRGTPYREYFDAVERLLVEHGGRPHWGKLHTREAGYLAEAYPRFAEFLAVREQLDPERRFGNAYLRRVLGD